MKDVRIGFAMTGSFCTLNQGLDALRGLKKRYEQVIPILSETAAKTDTRFGRGQDLQQEISEICGRGSIQTVVQAEPIGPQRLLDVLIIAPCTGNTLAKLAAGIADTAVTMAAKAHLRNGRPVVLAISTNDGLAGAARNIGELLCRKQFYFVPFFQDDPVEKPTSLVADLTQLTVTMEAALNGIQQQPVLLGPSAG